MNTKTKDKKYLGRDSYNTTLEIVKSDGNYLIDSKRKKYIDFLMGWCVGNIGWGNKEVKNKIKKYSGPDYVLPDFLYKKWTELAELLARITPGKLQKCFRATGGTESVEIALQAAMMHTKRNKFISIEGSYHGHSIGAMSVGDSAFRNWYNNLLPNCYKIQPPLDENALKKVKELLEGKDVAALIIEPIICNLGVTIPEKKFMTGIQKYCKQFGTLLIMDEVATGFGRTGKMFASEHYNIKPDIMCLAKGITGGYGGLGCTITTPEVAKSMEFDFSFYSTFGWQPLNVEAALANLNYLIKNKKKILTNVDKISRYFNKRLREIKFKHTPVIRIKGLAIAIEFNDDKYVSEVAEKCKDKGLILSTSNNKIITIFPALNIDIKTTEKGLRILQNCV